MTPNKDNQAVTNGNHDLDLSRIFITLWQGRKIIMLLVGLSLFFSILYSLLADEIYQVSCTIRPATPSKEVYLGNLASALNSFNFQGKEESLMSKMISSSVNSGTFLLRVYEKYQDSELLFGDKLQDIVKENLSDLQTKEKQRAMGLELLREVLIVEADVKKDLISLSVRSKDKYFAYKLLQEILVMLKIYVRERNLHYMDEDIIFFKQSYEKIDNPLIKDQIKKILKEKIEKSYRLTSNIFTLVEEPLVPYYNFFPKKKVIVFTTTFIGFILSLLIVFFIAFIKDDLKKVKIKIGRGDV